MSQQTGSPVAKRVTDIVLNKEKQRRHLKDFMNQHTPEQVFDIACKEKNPSFLDFLLDNIWNVAQKEDETPDLDLSRHHLDCYESAIAKYLKEDHKDKVKFLMSTKWKTVVGGVAVELFVGNRPLYRPEDNS